MTTTQAHILYNWTPHHRGQFQLHSRVHRHSEAMEVTFELKGSTSQLSLRPHKGGQRCDDLWKDTCFEVFFHHSSSTSNQYWEINCAPNGDWNFYHLDDYRQNLKSEKLGQVQLTLFEIQPDQLRIAFKIEGPISEELQLAATAVIKTLDGTVSYWSTCIADNKPDFHLKSIRTLKLLNEGSR
ncbi:MAG: hypothetical protein ACLGGX_03940 [Bdellovibrionia bacterium]